MISEILHQRRTIIFIGGVVIIVALAITAIVLLPLFTPENIKKGEIKEEVSKKINRQDFDIEQILVDSDDWTLGRITSTNENDKGNPALVILHKENNRLILKFGPGTNFSKSELDKAGVPSTVQDAIFGGQSKYITDPIIEYMPYDTNFYSVRYAPNLDAKPGEEKALDITIYEVPRLGIYTTPQKKAEYKAEVEEWIRSKGLDPTTYKIFFST